MGCAPPPPPREMPCGFLIQLVFCKKKKYVVSSSHQSVTPFLSGAPPPKKNPGSPLLLCFLIIMCCIRLFLKGCRSTSSGKHLTTDCNACRYVKNAVTGECLEKCPEGWDKMDDNTCVKSECPLRAC